MSRTRRPSQSECVSVDARLTSLPIPAATPASRPVADVLAIEGMDYGAFVEGYTQMVDAWTPAMAGATFSG